MAIYTNNIYFKVYVTDQVPGFVRLCDTDQDELIHKYQDDRLQDGIYRVRYSKGGSCFGTQIFAKSLAKGEEDKIYRLYKYPNGVIEYHEHVYVYGQNEEWRYLSTYMFQPLNLEWKEVSL